MAGLKHFTMSFNQFGQVCDIRVVILANSTTENKNASRLVSAEYNICPVYTPVQDILACSDKFFL